MVSASWSTVQLEEWEPRCSNSGKLAGLEMYGTAIPSSHELVSILGATPIDYRNEDFVAARPQRWPSDGVDVCESTPSVAPASCGAHTGPCAGAAAWCGWAPPRPGGERRGAGLVQPAGRSACSS